MIAKAHDGNGAITVNDNSDPCEMIRVMAPCRDTKTPHKLRRSRVAAPQIAPTNPNSRADSPPPSVLPLDSDWSAPSLVQPHGCYSSRFSFGTESLWFALRDRMRISAS